MVLNAISPGCQVQASLMRFLNERGSILHMCNSIHHPPRKTRVKPNVKLLRHFSSIWYTQLCAEPSHLSSTIIANNDAFIGFFKIPEEFYLQMTTRHLSY